MADLYPADTWNDTCILLRAYDEQLREHYVDEQNGLLAHVYVLKGRQASVARLWHLLFSSWRL